MRSLLLSFSKPHLMLKKPFTPVSYLTLCVEPNQTGPAWLRISDSINATELNCTHCIPTILYSGKFSQISAIALSLSTKTRHLRIKFSRIIVCREIFVGGSPPAQFGCVRTLIIQSGTARLGSNALVQLTVLLLYLQCIAQVSQATLNMS